MNDYRSLRTVRDVVEAKLSNLTSAGGWRAASDAAEGPRRPSQPGISALGDSGKATIIWGRPKTSPQQVAKGWSGMNPNGAQRSPLKIRDWAHVGAVGVLPRPHTERDGAPSVAPPLSEDPNKVPPPTCFPCASTGFYFSISVAARAGTQSSYCRNGAIIFKRVSFMKSWARDKSK